MLSQLGELQTRSTGQKAAPHGFLHLICPRWKDKKEAPEYSCPGVMAGGRGDCSPAACPPLDCGRVSWCRAVGCRDQHSQRTEHPVLLDSVITNSA